MRLTGPLFISIYAAWAASACIIDWDRVDPDNAPPPPPPTTCEPGETKACYSGRAGTEGVGICVGGTTTCDESGSFGECEGEIVPIAEDCTTPEDDDCDGAPNEIAEGCDCMPGALYPCYDGPEGTENVGLCIGGQALCTDEQTLGACVGQVLPMLEQCHTAADDDCDEAVNVDCPTEGLRYDSRSGHTIVWSLALTGNDDMVIAGRIDNGVRIDFGGGDIENTATSTSTQYYDGFVTKLAADGSHIWTTHIDSGDTDRSEVFGADVDAAGHVYVTGSFQGTVNFGPTVGDVVAAADTSAFIARLDSATGVASWVIPLGDAGANTVARGVATDDAGLSLVIGDWLGDITIGGAPPESSNSRDGFALLVTEGGVITWETTFGGGGSDFGYDAAFDGGGNLILAGDFDESLDFGGPGIQDDDANDGFVAKLSPTGTQLWIAKMGGVEDQTLRAVAIDANDNIIAFGENFGTADAGLGQLPTAGGADIIALKIAPDGNVTWAQNWGGADDQSCGGVTTTAAGEIWLGISHEQSADYGGGIPVLSAGNDDWVLVKLDGDGNHVRTHRYGDNSDQDPRGLQIDSRGRLVTAGDCTGFVELGVGDLGTSSNEDVCVIMQPQ